MALPSYLDPDGQRCGVCDRRCRNNADAGACERSHDAELAKQSNPQPTEEHAT